MQVELLKDWQGYRAGAIFPMEIMGGGIYDILQRNNMARLLPGSDSAEPKPGIGAAHAASGDTADQRAGNDRRNKNANQHGRKR
jgi:hypothetical protein